MTYSADGNLFASASEDGTIRHGFKQRRATAIASRLRCSPGRTPAPSARVAYRGDTLLAAADDHGLIKVWSLERGQLARDLERVDRGGRRSTFETGGRGP